MSRKKTDLAIVNRDFWPKSQVIGEALLQFAEQAAQHHSVCVITQADEDLAAQLASARRGEGIRVRGCRAFTTSASGLLKRAAEAVFFMGWVFISLVRLKPASVYVSTNPPVVVPFIVAVYCRIFGARYMYHLQDIHPEAANIVAPIKGPLFRILQSIDNYTLRHAETIITLSDDMKNYIRQRSESSVPISLLDNPSFEVDPVPLDQRTKDIVFCGNAGRLQRIPLLLGAIRDYLQQGGELSFTFAGGGVYAQEVQALADCYEKVEYLGVIPATEAAELVNQHRWALLPIDDEVTRYAFPSKSSGYALSGAVVLAVCGEDTSVARWVTQNNVGIVLPPNQTAIVDGFFGLEKQIFKSHLMDEEARRKLLIPHFASELHRLFISNRVKGQEKNA